MLNRKLCLIKDFLIFSNLFSSLIFVLDIKKSSSQKIFLISTDTYIINPPTYAYDIKGKIISFESKFVLLFISFGVLNN